MSRHLTVTLQLLTQLPRPRHPTPRHLPLRLFLPQTTPRHLTLRHLTVTLPKLPRLTPRTLQKLTLRHLTVTMEFLTKRHLTLRHLTVPMEFLTKLPTPINQRRKRSSRSC